MVKYRQAQSLLGADFLFTKMVQTYEILPEGVTVPR